MKRIPPLLLSRAIAIPILFASNLAAIASELTTHEWHQHLSISATGYPTQTVSLGQLRGSLDGHDNNDQPALSPFNTPYIRLLIPHPEWGAPGEPYFRSDYRNARPGEYLWYLEIHASEAGMVTLSWDDPDGQLAQTQLYDMEHDMVLSPEPDGEYQVNMLGPLHRLEWRVSIPDDNPVIMDSSFEAVVSTQGD